MDIFYIPQPVAVDSSGTPMAGAKLNFYAAGTSTPEPIYTTAALSTEHSNPVVADSSGRFPAIYLGTANDYKVVFTTSADVVVYTQDDIRNSLVPNAKIGDGAITTAKILNDAVTLAKMAHGTQGGLLYYGASGVPNELAAGAAGQILTSGGAGANPAWSSAPLPADHVSGLSLSLNAVDGDHDIDMAAGRVRDSTDTVNIVLAAQTVQCDVTFGTDDGILKSGLTLTADTPYYLFAIAKASGADPKLFLFNTSDPSGDLPTDYVYFRALNGGIPLLTDSSANLINSMNGEFVSSAQTITTGGTLSLTHGLGSAPKFIDCDAYATCTTAQLGFSIGEEVAVMTRPGDSASKGVRINPTATTLEIRFANAANVFAVVNDTDGTVNDMTNTSWTVTFTAKVNS